MKNDPACCPLCKEHLGTVKPVTLWPSDFDDLDTYLHHRNRRLEKQRSHRDVGRAVPATSALDRYMSREAQAALLGKLLDFRQHIAAYVMAVNNVSMSVYGGEDRIFRLFQDLTKGVSGSENFEVGGSGKELEYPLISNQSSLEALNAATNLLQDTVASLEKLRQETEEKNRVATENLEKSDRMKQSFLKHMDTKASEEQRMNAEAGRVHRLQLHLKKELQEVERRRKAMDEERRVFVNEAREQAVEARKARLESAHQIAQSRGEADTKMNELNKYVGEQERLRMDAEERAREARKKSNWLADRNKLLASKLESARKEAKQLREAAAVSTMPSSLTSTVSSTSKGKAKEEPDDASQAGPNAAVHGDEAQSQYGDIVQEARALDELQQNLRSTQDAVVIEDDDLDAELDDANFPMPVYSRTTSGHNSRMQNAPSSHDDDDYVEFVGKRKRSVGNDTDPMKRSHSVGASSSTIPSSSALLDRVLQGHLQLGPRRRAR